MDTQTVGGGTQRIASAALLVAVAVAGVAVLLVFWNTVMPSEDFASLSLPVVAMVAAVAATFNPCSLPALPGFVAAAGAAGGEATARRRLQLSLAAAVGAAAVVVALGVLLAVAGAGITSVVELRFRWVQLVVGLFLVAVAVLHLAGKTSGLPLVGSVVGAGNRVWEAGMERPGIRSSLAWGAGFVAIGGG